MKKYLWHSLTAGFACAVLGASLAAQQPAPQAATQSADEDVARRQLESGRSFMRQGNYTEALKDFRAVADTHATSSVADDALLEIGRYYFEIANDYPAATTAVDDLLKKYPTSNSAPDAYVLAGRLALARSHQPSDLEAALANFDRVIRLFPASNAVASALTWSGETHWYRGQLDEALAEFGRAESEYPTTTAAAEAYIGESRVLVSRGDPVSALEELQQVVNRFPGTPQAAVATARATLLYRLYVRAAVGAPVYTLAADPVGPAKLENVNGLAITSRGALYDSTEIGAAGVLPADAPKPPVAMKPKGLAIDAAGNLAVFEAAMLHPGQAAAFAFPVSRSNGATEALSKVMAVGQLSNGDWLVMDEGEKFMYRYSRTGTFIGPFGTTRMSKFAMNAVDEVAGFDRDQKAITLLDATAKPVGRIPYKGAGYELQNPEDIAFDAFGHLYVLDRGALVVFSPYPPPADGAKPAAPAAAAPVGAGQRGTAYRLLMVYTEPEKSPGAFRKGTSFAFDQAGTMYLYDDRAQRILVYR
jgi:TolA-binding protein